MTKGEQTRRQIIAAAAPIFNQRGYEGSSLSELMAVTGLEKGGIYRHFSNKEELAVAAFEYSWKAARDLRLEGLEHLRGIQWLKQYIANFVEHRNPVSGGCPVLNTAVDADDGNPALRAHAVKAVKSWRTRLQTIIERGMEDGEIRSDIDAKAAATLIIATLEGALMISRLEKSYLSMRQAQKHLEHYLERELAAQPASSSVQPLSGPDL